MKLLPGTMVTSNVKLVLPLGQGGMGSVWLAKHLTLETDVAVKFISPELLRAGTSDVLMRFKREAKAAARIKSPHVVQTHDHGVTSDGVPYIVMELLEGESLADRLQRTNIVNLREASIVVRHVANALIEAHKLGIVHRDIKPDNLFLTTSADQLFVKVLDFGIAKSTRVDTLGVATVSGAIIGTPEYMSPEQMLSSKEIDHRTDVWSLGVVIYEMITGRRPFVNTPGAPLALSICQASYPKASEARPGLPTTFDAFFEQVLRPDADSRTASPKELADAFDAVIRTMSEEATFEDAPPTKIVEPESSTLPLPDSSGSRKTVRSDLASEAAAQSAEPEKREARKRPSTLESASATLRSAGEERSRGKVWMLAAVGALGAAAALVLWQAGAEPEPEPEPERRAAALPTASTPRSTAVPSATVPSATAPPASASPAPPHAATARSDGMSRVVIDAGAYRIGCDDTSRCWPDEAPEHQVQLEAFALMRFEVTVAEYAECVDHGACTRPEDRPGCVYVPRHAKRPINCVTHAQAEKYCAFIGGRLPSELEWEAAARGPDGHDYPWGSEAPSCARAVIHDARGPGCGSGGPLRTGARPKDESWAGVRDLAGSVREWTSSEYRAYPGGKEPEASELWVARGGSFLMPAGDMATSHTRGSEAPDVARSDLGFRCVLSR